ncbi:hypothetical protein A6A06_18925 [Streptomyces sp. CB02923]|nr:hypothetical protein A6A06_18925 [Streptomyces sp. CB02923]
MGRVTLGIQRGAEQAEQQPAGSQSGVQVDVDAARAGATACCTPMPYRSAYCRSHTSAATTRRNERLRPGEPSSSPPADHRWGPLSRANFLKSPTQELKVVAPPPRDSHDPRQSHSLSSGKTSAPDRLRARRTAEEAAFREETAMRGGREFTGFHIERPEAGR